MTPEQKEKMEAAPFPIVFSCIDLIMTIGNKLIFIKKSYKDDLLRLPGGMVDVTDLSMKDVVRREANEEIGAEPENVLFDDNFKVTSFITQDSGRYNPSSSKHRLRTTLFSARYNQFICDCSGEALAGLKAGDDATDVVLVPINQLYDIDWVIRNVAPGHIPLLYYWMGQNYDNRKF